MWTYRIGGRDRSAAGIAEGREVSYWETIR